MDHLWRGGSGTARNLRGLIMLFAHPRAFRIASVTVGTLVTLSYLVVGLLFALFIVIPPASLVTVAGIAGIRADGTQRTVRRLQNGMIALTLLALGLDIFLFVAIA